MAIYVNNKKYDVVGRQNVDAFNTLMHAICALPLTPIEEKPGAQVIACLEAEVSQCADTHGVELGTENIKNCMALYLYGGGRRFLVHVNDYQVDLQLNRYLERFPAHATVNAIIIGGILSHRKHSSLNCIHIVDSLTRANRDITIVSQRILELIPTDTSARNEETLDMLMIHLKLFYKYLFSHKMPNETINLFKASDFDKDREHYAIVDPNFSNLINMVIHMSPIRKDKHSQEFARLKMQGVWENVKQSTFESWMLEVVSKRGMKYLQDVKYVDSNDNTKNCINFFFHHGNDGCVKICRMGMHHEKPFESERKLHLYSNPNMGRALNYYDAYLDGYFNKPIISDEILNKVRTVKNHLEIGQSAQVIQAIKTLFPTVTFAHYQLFADAILHYDVPKQASSAACSIISFAFLPFQLDDDNRSKRIKMSLSDSSE